MAKYLVLMLLVASLVATLFPGSSPTQPPWRERRHWDQIGMGMRLHKLVGGDLKARKFFWLHIFLLFYVEVKARGNSWLQDLNVSPVS